MKLIYVAGPFSAPNDIEVEINILKAERVGESVRQVGGFPIIPHANGRNFKHLGHYEYWLAGTLELMRRCDAVILVPGWEASAGTCGEINEASRLGIPVFHTPGQLAEWLRAQISQVTPAPRALFR